MFHSHTQLIASSIQGVIPSMGNEISPTHRPKTSNETRRECDMKQLICRGYKTEQPMIRYVCGVFPNVYNFQFHQALKDENHTIPFGAAAQRSCACQ